MGVGTVDADRQIGLTKTQSIHAAMLAHGEGPVVTIRYCFFVTEAVLAMLAVTAMGTGGGPCPKQQRTLAVGKSMITYLARRQIMMI